MAPIYRPACCVLDRSLAWWVWRVLRALAVFEGRSGRGTASVGWGNPDRRHFAKALGVYPRSAQRLRPITLDADLRSMHRAVADLIEHQITTTHPTQRAVLDRMIQDLEAEMAIRKVVPFRRRPARAIFI